MEDKNKTNQHHNHKNDNVEHSSHNKMNSSENKTKNESSQHEDHDSHDHHDHHQMMIKDFRLRFWISLIFTLPILALSPMVQDLFGFEFSPLCISY